MSITNLSDYYKGGIFIKLMFSRVFVNRYLVYIGLLNIVMGLVPVLYLHIFSQMIQIVSEKDSLSRFIMYSIALIAIVVLLPLLTDYAVVFELLYDKDLKEILVKSTNDYYKDLNLLEVQLDEFQNKFIFIQSTDSFVKEFYFLMFNMLKAIITLIGTLLLLKDFSVWFICIVILGSVISIMLNKFIGKIQFESELNLTEDSRLESTHYTTLQNSNNQKYIFYNNYFNKIYSLWSQKISYTTKEKIRYQNKMLKINILSETTLGITFLSICIMLYFSVVSSISSVVMVLQSIGNFQNSIAQLGDGVTQYFNLKLRGQYIKDFLIFITSDRDKRSYENEGPDKNFINKIEIKNGTFSYPGRNDFEINIKENFTLNSGNIYGVLGGNGNGKSTLLNLVTGIYSFNESELYINDERISSRKYKFIMKKRASIAFQENLKISSVLADNLNIEPTIKNYSTLNLVKDLKNYSNIADKILDNSYQNGTDLSGGQWQHIFLVRSMMKKHTNFFVLDEPTTFLDAIKIKKLSEDLIMLKELGWIILIVTHDEKLYSIIDEFYEVDTKGLLQKWEKEEYLKNRLLEVSK